jgi:hypothetical protein
MLITNIKDLKPANSQAVIINAGTKLVTTLALMSTLKYAGMRVLVIDCESKDGSMEYFCKLMDEYDFDVFSAPLRQHGDMLDWLFMNIPADKVLLIDSDAEILCPEIITTMKDFIDNELVFGTGFVHGPEWLDDRHGAGYQVGYYQERMWIPLAFLKVSLVREAILNRYSFLDHIVYNDFAPSQFISKVLYQRFRFRFLKNSRLSWLNYFKRSFYGLKPCYLYCDTGADIFQYLKYKRGYDYVGYPARINSKFVGHYHGITRLLLNPSDNNGTVISDIITHVKKRLMEIYKIDI